MKKVIEKMKDYVTDKKQLGIRYVLAIVIISVAFFLSLVALVMNTDSFSEQLRRNMAISTNELTEQITSEVSTSIHMRKNYIVNLAEYYSTKDPLCLSEERMNRNAECMGLEDIFVLYADGTTFAADHTYEELIQYVMENKIFNGEKQKLFVLDADELIFSSPIVWKNHEPALLIGVYSTATMQNTFNNLVAHCEGYCGIVDQNGKTIVSATDEDIIKKAENVFSKNKKDIESEIQKTVKKIKDSESGVTVYEHTKDESVILGYHSLGINDWYVLALVPTQRFTTGVDTYIMRYLIIIFLMSCFITGIFICLKKFYSCTLNRIKKVALTDGLTNGNNIDGFRIESECLLKNNPQQKYAIVYLNIHNFKHLNEYFGVIKGDEILIKIYDVLQRRLLEGEYLARAEGDHYYLLLQCESKEELVKRLDEISTTIARMFYNYFHLDNVYTVFGVYIIKEQDSNDILLMESRAKAASAYTTRDQMVYFYNNELEAKLAYEGQLEENFSRAIVNHEFKVYIQPKVAASHKTLQSGEVLVRWQTSEGEMIPPGEFIPLFERNGTICTLDFYIFEETCKLLRKWIDEGKAVSLSVNLSRAHLATGNLDFLDTFAAIKTRYGIPDRMIEFEFTESIMLERNEVPLVVAMVDRMHELGFLCSIDDFGFGYSCLTVLKDFNVDTVKFDRQFFIDENDKSWHVVYQLIQLAHYLNISVVAEGIENQEQVDKLWSYGCEYIQGYVFAKPMPADEFINWTLK